LPEAVSFESRRHGGLLRHGIVAFLGFGWRDVADDGVGVAPVWWTGWGLGGLG
jgi:hypothetical protein